MPRTIPDVREQIIKKAGEILQNEGMTSLSLSALTKQCKISYGTIYLHFKDKYDLVDAVFKDVWRTIYQTNTNQTLKMSATEEMIALYETVVSFLNHFSSVFQKQDSISRATLYEKKANQLLYNLTYEALQKILARYNLPQRSSSLALETDILLSACRSRSARPDEVKRLITYIMTGAVHG